VQKKQEMNADLERREKARREVMAQPPSFEDSRGKGGSQHTITEADIEEEQEKIASYEVRRAERRTAQHGTAQRSIARAAGLRSMLRRRAGGAGEGAARRACVRSRRGRVVGRALCGGVRCADVCWHDVLGRRPSGRSRRRRASPT
jgi:hypothetical protein